MCVRVCVTWVARLILCDTCGTPPTSALAPTRVLPKKSLATQTECAHIYSMQCSARISDRIVLFLPGMNTQIVCRSLLAPRMSCHFHNVAFGPR